MEKQSLVPPAEMIVESHIGGVTPGVDPAEAFLRIGLAAMRELITTAGLTPESRVLDLGCGLGRTASALSGYLTTGTYTGIDIMKSSIDWCSAQYARFPNFKFVLADASNSHYPGGAADATTYRLPFDDETFDIVFTISLYTHMFLDAIDNYLGETGRVMKRGGRTRNTFSLLDDRVLKELEQPRTDGRWYRFPIGGGLATVASDPERDIAHFLDKIEAIHEKHGLRIERVVRTNWSGAFPEIPETPFRHRGQDVILAVKA